MREINIGTIIKIIITKFWLLVIMLLISSVSSFLYYQIKENTYFNNFEISSQIAIVDTDQIYSDISEMQSLRDIFYSKNMQKSVLKLSKLLDESNYESSVIFSIAPNSRIGTIIVRMSDKNEAKKIHRFVRNKVADVWISTFKFSDKSIVDIGEPAFTNDIPKTSFMKIFLLFNAAAVIAFLIIVSYLLDANRM